MNFDPYAATIARQLLVRQKLIDQRNDRATQFAASQARIAAMQSDDPSAKLWLTHEMANPAFIPDSFVDVTVSPAPAGSQGPQRPRLFATSTMSNDTMTLPGTDDTPDGPQVPDLQTAIALMSNQAMPNDANFTPAQKAARRRRNIALWKAAHPRPVRPLPPSPIQRPVPTPPVMTAPGGRPMQSFDPFAVGDPFEGHSGFGVGSPFATGENAVVTPASLPAALPTTRPLLKWGMLALLGFGGLYLLQHRKRIVAKVKSIARV